MFTSTHRARVLAGLLCTLAICGSMLPLMASPAAAAGHAADLGEDVVAFGAAGFHGSSAAFDLKAPIVGMASTPTGAGYWEVASDGGIFAFGDAGFFGSEGGSRLNAPITGVAASPSGRGYWLVASDGGIFAFGDAGFFGSEGGSRLNAPITGMAATPSGRGYWLVASDGGIFAFGDAGFFGSQGGSPLNAPITGMAATPSGRGYWLVASDGGIFAFGDAAFFGSLGGSRIHQRVVGIAADPVGGGYWQVNQGTCSFTGSTADKGGGPNVGQSWLSAVAATAHTCWEQAAFQFQSSGPSPTYTVGYRSPPFAGPSGMPVAVSGNAFLVVRVSGSGFNQTTGMPSYTGPQDIVPTGTTMIREVREIEDFEGVLVWVIGLDRARPFATYSTATQLVVEVG